MTPDLRCRPIARLLGHRHQRPLTSRAADRCSLARLPLPRLERRRALNAIRVRIALKGQRRREPVLGIPVTRPAPPPLPPLRRLAIPPTPHHH